ncbi:carboxymuconolactone decarboxylase family protein [Rhodococcus sp. DMU1]|uniref:carboxymuconolactone decarboxylase family protein n=1 Tax=Rhodococcus sp. DMU1 TaxID=2722825 RepID=UPI00143EE855|nr:carboxymuconolactone decarboxylase family protein [Rhodococcus sp. DMU1]QIX52679.1 carboxymuconolactone decarboxylase family protein [Rhodococcus sp. DMU1]
MPLLPPLPAEHWDDRTRSALSGILPKWRRNPVDAGNALATMVHHPDLAESFTKFSVHLLFGSTLSPRLRELVIIRVAQRRNCTYEVEHHAELGREVGLSDEEIAAARTGEAIDKFEHLVLAAIDELDDTSRLSEETWNALGEHLDVRQRMDFVFTVGGYCLMSMAFNTFGIELDEDVELDESLRGGLDGTVETGKER